MEPIRGHKKPQAPVLLQNAAQHDESSHSGATEICRLLYLFFPTAYHTVDYFCLAPSAMFYCFGGNWIQAQGFIYILFIYPVSCSCIQLVFIAHRLDFSA